MTKFLLGKKIGMTNIISKEGVMVPVTVISIDPCFVTQIKKKESDDYEALQIGSFEKKKIKKPQEGHLKKSGKKLGKLKEFRTEVKDSKIGDSIDISVFEKGDKIKVTGNIKGKGFAGGIKRWGFRSHPSSHGHPEQRRIGSIGSAFPQHVFKGKKMPGRKGPSRKTILNLEVADVDKDNNLLLVKGSVPGIRGGLLEIKG